MNLGDALILDDLIPPPVLSIKGISDSVIEYERHDRIGGRRVCMLVKWDSQDFIHLGRYSGKSVYGYRKDRISEARLHELFEMLSLTDEEQDALREKAARETAQRHAQKMVIANQIARDSQPTVQEIAKISLSELDYFREHFKPQSPNEFYLSGEPFVASLELVKADASKEVLLICRGYTPLRLDPKTPGAIFASYLSPKGSLAAGLPGKTIDFQTRYRGDDNRCVLIWKSTFTPTRNDLIDAAVATQGKLSRVNSMRRLDVYHETPLPEPGQVKQVTIQPSKPEQRAQPAPERPPFQQPPKIAVPEPADSHEDLRSERDQAPEPPSIPPEKPLPFTPPASPHRQSVECGVALHMKAILDPVQDAIFRSPLNSRIRISGGPGTGKTTVLLKRLSQKNKFEYLNDEEKSLFQGDREWREQDWYLFSPSDLLKGYLEKALAKELLPAGDEHVKVYATFRNEILRDLGVLRVGKHGTLTFVSEEELGEEEMPTIDRGFVVAFAKHLQAVYERTVNGAIADALNRLMEVAEELRAGVSPGVADPVLREIDFEAEKLRSTKCRGPIRAREFVQRMDAASSHVGAVLGILKRSTVVANAVKGKSDALGAIGKLRPMDLVFGRIAAAYVEFRDGGTGGSRGSARACAPELDLILFAVLETLHQLWDFIRSGSVSIPAKIKNLAGQLRVNVCIDEVTDFSPIEIACMEKFAVPKVGGITVCGDLMQRVTSRGIAEWDDLEVFSKGLVGHELAIAYRQTGRLFSVARDLFVAKTGLTSIDFRSAYPIQAEDPPALALQLADEDEITAWIAERVFEVFGLCGQHLPTIAILVPDGDAIGGIASRLRKLLAPAGIEVDASPTGAFLGNPSRVRVFPVTAIKGLEFEAVFYVDLDIMARLQPDLIDKYMYVGLSRARSFLGVTYRQDFPEQLDEIIDHFLEQESFER
jgi:hypothetical protein